MSKKLLTKLLAFVMSAGLIMQPVVAFAEEAGDENVLDVEVLDEIEEEKVLDNAVTDEVEVRKGLATIENARIEDDILTWDYLDLDGEEIRYWVGLDSNYQSFDVNFVYLRKLLRDLGNGYGKYTLELFAVNSNLKVRSNVCYIEYDFVDKEEKETIKISTATASSDYKTLPRVGNPVTEPYFEINEDIPIEIAGSWCKVDDKGNWLPYTEDTFTPGMYHYRAEIWVTDRLAIEYELDQRFQFCVDNRWWTRVQYISGAREKQIFASEEITISAEYPIEPEKEGHWYEKYGATYYELPDGNNATGMQKIDEDYYYFSESGKLQRGIFCGVDGKQYFFGEDGKMVTGWFTRWKETYYAQEDGVIQTGFVDIGDDTYLFDYFTGKQKKSVWGSTNDGTFYIKADGRMAKSETITRWGKEYSFNENGRLIK